MPVKTVTHNWPVSPWQLLWWLVAIGMAVLLKHHYSVAEVAELQWLFHPLAIVLELITGHGFYQGTNDEWFSQGADIRLVKGCAGINFMIMSFLLYSWIFRPERAGASGVVAPLLSIMLLATAALGAAWLTCLLANSVRIVMAMTALTHEWHNMIPGVDQHQLHRFIGMAVYMPVLSLQMLLDSRSLHKTVMVCLVPILVYTLILIVVPILTGNALKDTNVFLDHLLSMACSTGIAAIVLVAHPVIAINIKSLEK